MSVKAEAILTVSNSTVCDVVDSKQGHEQAVQPNTPLVLTKKSYYVPNMLRTLQENTDKIVALKKGIDLAILGLDPKLHHELLERNKLNNERFSKFTKNHLELKMALENGSDVSSQAAKLPNFVNEIFELYRQFYILNLDIRALKVNEFFKIDQNLKISEEILREVYHTIQLHIPDFNEYFKYKKKTAGQSDYRTAIKWVSFKEKSVDKAVEALRENADFVNAKLGKEKVLVAEFSNLSESDDFNNLSRRISQDLNEAIIGYVFIANRQCIIFFLKDFQTKCMDLHGCDSKMAAEHAEIYVRDRFLQFNDFANLMTGRGNHSASGKSQNQLKLLKQLALWKSSDKHFIESFQVTTDGGSIGIKFCPVKSIHVAKLWDADFFTKLAQAIENQTHRIIIKLDKKYPARTLEQIAINLTIHGLQINTNLKVGALFPKQSKVEDDSIRLFFTYPNANVKLFEYNSNVNSLAHTKWPAITMAIPIQKPKKIALQPKSVDSVVAAKTISAAEVVSKVAAATKPILHSLHLKKTKRNKAGTNQKVFNEKTASNKNGK